ncbi:MAG TPA: hypothetical protein VHS34_12520 [Terriglobales bacterium]|jgi:hypothetical protein|nr:hypothetical protein [Terriglobales bacterium]
MTRTKSPSGVLLLACLIMVWSGVAFGAPNKAGATRVAQTVSTDVAGTWSGSFQSTHPETAPFTMTIVIAPGSDGQLSGSAKLASDCFKEGSLHVTINGATVVFAGSDAESNNITFRGSLDSSRTLLNMHYVVNGSASARCESDEGEGSLVKR